MNEFGMLRIILKTVIWTLVGLTAFVVLYLAFNFALLTLLDAFGLGDAAFNAVKWVLLFALFLAPWSKIKIKRPLTLSHTVLIDAPLQTVWNAIRPRHHHTSFRKFYSDIRAVDDTNKKFLFVPHDAVAKDVPGTGPMNITIVHEVPLKELSLAHENREDQGGLGIGASVESYSLEETDDGIRVSIVEVVEHWSFWLVVTRFVVNPVKDTLTSLKHYCEGTEDVSFVARQMQDVLENGGQATRNGVFFAGATVCIVLTAVTFGIVSLALSLGQ